MHRSSIIRENTTLPPNVRGKSRGFIEVGITSIKWKNKSLVNRYENLEVIAKIIWWGQNKLSARELHFNKARIIESNCVVQYTILTNCKLFYNYLINCEPIQILLFTKTSNYNIGLSKAKIPIQILKSCNNFLTGETIACTESQKYSIENEKGTNIGELILTFKIMFYDPISDRENAFNTTFAKPDKIDLDKEVEIISSSRSYKGFKDKLKYDNDKEICSSRVATYLSGRKMSKRDEEQALKEIQRISPIGNELLDSLRINIPKSPEPVAKILSQSNRNMHSCCNITYDRMDSLYLNVKHIKLLAPGIREVLVKSLINTSFTVECKISPNLLDSDLKRRLNYDVIRFYSNTFDDKEQRIDFNKDAIRSIKLICNESDEILTEHSEILFTIWWREYGSRYSRCLGTTKYRFTNLFKKLEKPEDIKLSVKSCTAGVHIADLYCKVILGSNISYIGNEFYGLNKSSKNFHNEMQYQENQCPSGCKQAFNYRDKIKKTPNNENCNSNRARENTNAAEPKQTISSPYCSSIGPSNTTRQQFDGEDQNNTYVQSIERDIIENHNLFKGLLYIGEMQNVNNTDNSNYFCVARAFWKDDPSSSGFSYNNNFNFIEVFSIINDTNFLDRVRNNILIVELWQKSVETHEKLFGIIRISLHQFYIAFRDPVLTNHLCKAKLPVISIDGLAPIVSPLSGIVYGQIQALLCIGTEEQLENLKRSRGFNLDTVYDNNLYTGNPSNVPIPQISTAPQQNHNTLNEILTIKNIPQYNTSNDVESQTDIQKENNANYFPEIDSKNNKEKLSNILGNFLDNISQKLPPPSPSSSSLPQSNGPEPEQKQNDQQNSLRRTSDLLDILQKALMQPPNPSNNESSVILKTIGTSTPVLNSFKIFLEIECALHLPRNPAKMISKKNKRNKGKQSRFPPNEEPSAYVTFQAEEGYGQMFKSHEGMVYATNVIEKSSNPSWGKRFEICISSEYLTKENNPFMLRVWKKAATDLAHCRLLPTPMEDSIIGVSSVDLTVLMARIPFITGWYNIIDFSGKVNGQIKINIKPLEDVLKFKIIRQVEKPESKISSSISFLNTKSTANNSNFDLADLGLGLGMDMSLSRAFKRKLVELEEINQRLRARLLDVTGEADPDIDMSEVDDEQMDEFERDLNTECKEDDVENIQNIGKNDNYLWLNSNNHHSGAAGDKQKSEYRFQPTKNGNSNNDSNQEKIKIISEFLKKTEISNEKSTTDNENK